MSSEKFQNLQHLSESDMYDFWKRVNQLIKVKKLTQEDVANSISVNYTTFRGWSHYKRYPDLVDIFHLAQVLDTSINYLIFGTESEPSTKASFLIGEAVLSLVNLVKKGLKIV